MEFKNTLTNSNGQQVLNETKVDNYLVISAYSLREFIKWWYIKMPIWHLRMLSRVSTFVDDNLSISLLFKTFFVPWHRDASFVGYFFGLIIKILYLPLAILIYSLVILLYLFIVFIWLLLPLATVFFIFRSLLRI